MREVPSLIKETYQALVVPSNINALDMHSRYGVALHYALDDRSLLSKTVMDSFPFSIASIVQYAFKMHAELPYLEGFLWNHAILGIHVP